MQPRHQSFELMLAPLLQTQRRGRRPEGPRGGGVEGHRLGVRLDQAQPDGERPQVEVPAQPDGPRQQRPLVGDDLYPRVRAVALDDYTNPLQLLARSIAFVDPFTAQRREFTSRRELAAA